MELKIESTFKCDYTLEIAEYIGQENQYFYPRDEKDGLWVRIRPFVGKPWIGVFAFGRVTPHGILAIYSMPDQDKFCVVSRGAGYVVSSTNPMEWQGVKLNPIVDVRCIQSHNIVVFADYTELIAYDRFGVKWRSRDVAYDGFKIVEVRGDTLIGKFWDTANEAEELFQLSLNDGLPTGGILGTRD